MNCDWKKKKDLLNYFPLASGFIRAKMVRIIRLTALEGLGVDAESSGWGREKQEVLVWPIIGHPASSSSLSSCVWCFKNLHLFFSAEAPAVILLEERRRQTLRKFYLIQLPCCPCFMFTLLFFLRAFVGGRDDGCVGAGRDGGFCVLSSAFPAVFSVTFSLYSICGS